LTGATFSASDVIVWNSAVISSSPSVRRFTFDGVVIRCEGAVGFGLRSSTTYFSPEHRGGHDRASTLAGIGANTWGRRSKVELEAAGLGRLVDLVDLSTRRFARRVGDLRAGGPSPDRARFGQHVSLVLSVKSPLLLQEHQHSTARRSEKTMDRANRERRERRFVDLPLDSSWRLHVKLKFGY